MVNIEAVGNVFTYTSKASLVNQSYTANNNFLPSNLTPNQTPCIFRIYVNMSASGILSVKRTIGAQTITEALNSNNALVANSAYLFDIVVDENESINLVYSVSGTINKCSVLEIDGVV